MSYCVLYTRFIVIEPSKVCYIRYTRKVCRLVIKLYIGQELFCVVQKLRNYVRMCHFAPLAYLVSHRSFAIWNRIETETMYLDCAIGHKET